jgi:Rieske Fe-S protein
MSDELLRRRRRHLLVGATPAVGATGLGIAATPYIAPLRPSATAGALREPVKIDVSTVKPAHQVTVAWRG